MIRKLSSVLSIALISLVSLFATPAVAKTFTVNSTADAVAANPTSGVCETGVGNGVCTLRAAIQVANASPGADIIIVPSGTYTLTISGPAEDAAASGDLDITDDLTINGAGAATTVIQACEIVAPAVSCTTNDRVFHVDPTGKLISATLRGLTIQNGTTIGISFVSANGGGIFLGVPQTAGSPVPSGTLTLVDCVVRNNRAAPSGVTAHGGGIAVNAGTLNLVNTVVSGNFTGLLGGGILLGDFSKTTITNSTISDNIANQSGGGIAMGGFDISVGGTQLTISNSTISNNQSGSGGGIFRNRGTLQMTNVTVSGNRAGSAAGIADSGTNNGPEVLNNVTITNNQSSSTAGGIGSSSGALTLMNSIVAGDTGFFGNFGGGPECAGTIISGGHNLIQQPAGCTITGDTATNITGKAAQLGVLANNGGPTQTHALLSGSPAIGTGSTDQPGSGGTSCAATDQRGVIRPQPEGGICDIGAFEFHGGLAVNGMTPNHAGNSGKIQAIVTGDSFTSGIQVKLHCGGTEIPGIAPTVDSTSSVITTSFDLSGAPLGPCDAVVTQTDGTSAVGSGVLQVETPVAPQLWAQLIARDAIRVGKRTRIQVLYGNRGNTDALGVALGISMTTNLGSGANFNVGAPPPQPGDLPTDWTKVTLAAVSKRAGRTFVPFLLPVVPTGFTGVLEFTIDPPVSVHGQQYSIEASIGPATVGSDLTPDPVMLADLVAGAKAYSQRFLGTTIPASKDVALNQYYRNVLAMIATQGCTPTDGKPLPSGVFLVCGYTRLLAGGASNGSGQPAPAPGAGGGGGDGGGDAGSDPGDDPPDCDDLGWCDEPPSPPACDKWPPTACGGVAPGGGPLVDAIDPNDKIGPIGVGASRFIASSVPLSYGVFFENLATATAAAQQVVVTDQLDPAKIDLSTFSFGPVAFGAQTVIPTPGLSTFTQDVDLRPTQNLVARVVGKLDTSTGLITWTFSSLDPITLQPTQDPLAGFLPPNTNPPAGEGSVIFSVQSRPEIATGTAISNQATVVFDSNAPILTPMWTNTIDAAAPASHVLPLPSTENLTSFPFSWTATDQGSGVFNFTVFVSEDGRPFTKFTTTSDTSATFTGRAGSTYSFFSVAEDLVGNVEATPTEAQATTQITTGDTIAPVTSANFAPAANGAGWNNSDVTVMLSANDNAGGSGVKNITLALNGAQTGTSVVAGGSASVGISAEGTTTLTYFSTDNVGNAEAPQTLTVRIDKTAPATPKANIVPAPNANGWNNSIPVTVNFVSDGDLGPVQSGVVSCTSPTTLTSETGGTAVTSTCTDASGNVSAATTVTARIDHTPPELAASCKLPTGLPNVTGVDAFSGIDSVTLTGSSPLNPRDPDDFSGQQKFTLLDRAGNNLVANFLVRSDDGHAAFSLRSLSYNNAAATPAPNLLLCESGGGEHRKRLSDFRQQLLLPTQGVLVEAHFNSGSNVTEIFVRRPGSNQHITRPGLVFLKLTTSQGALSFDF